MTARLICFTCSTFRALLRANFVRFALFLFTLSLSHTAVFA